MSVLFIPLTNIVGVNERSLPMLGPWKQEPHCPAIALLEPSEEHEAHKL